MFRLFFLFIALSSTLLSQNIYSEKQFQFLSYETIPTWAGVATGWQEPSPQIHIYDINKYQGHADYISFALKTGITFKQFKEQVKDYNTRKYMPFFLFDLRNSTINIDGQKYTWALKIQDYGFEDNQEQMEKSALKLLNTINDYIKKQSKEYSKGLIILATSTQVRPNTLCADFLKKNGYPNITQSKLIAHAGGKNVKVLNAGVGVGYLKYIKAGEEDKIKNINEKDIVIYELLPKRVPPVNGIITLEAQTPLSHVNLLAKNRGTINLYATDLDYLPQAKQNINKLVKITCNAEKITISEISEKEAENFWAKKSLKIEIPTAQVNEKKIINLNTPQVALQGASVIGAKASNYAIIRQNFPKYVQPGYAIPFVHYFNVIKNCGADTLIKQTTIQNLKDEALEKILKIIREKILNSTVDKNLITELKIIIENQFHSSKIRLRSSTNCEDLPGFNGAGLYISKGYNIKKDSTNILEKKILEIFASLWTKHAYEERAFYFIDHNKVGMAILINEAYENEYANGVVLTIPEKDDYSIAINTQYGDELVTNPKNGQIPEAILFKTKISNAYTVESKSSIHDIFIQQNLKPTLQELRKVSMEIHQKLTTSHANQKTQYGIDIEFKIIRIGEEYKLFIKQARLLGQVLPE